MSGGPKPPKVEEGQWGVPLKTTNPRGFEGDLLMTYQVHPDGSLVVHSKLTTANGVDVLSRYMQGDELILKIGPRVSAKDGKTLVEMKRIFKRKS
jgi:hypothetical protein